MLRAVLQVGGRDFLVGWVLEERITTEDTDVALISCGVGEKPRIDQMNTDVFESFGV